MNEKAKCKLDSIELINETENPIDSSGNGAASINADTRKMVKAELMGHHTHLTCNQTKVHIFMRNGKYIARGRFERKPFGKTLGSETIEANSELRRILTEIESGAFVRPSQAKNRPLKSKTIPNLSLRQLCDEFLAEKRKTTGNSTTRAYLNRLSPVLDFAEQKNSLRHWKFAVDIDREFAVECRVFLTNRQVSRNGSAGAPTKPMSSRQVVNCLQTLSMVLKWGLRAEVRQLPPEFVNPVTHNLIGQIPSKDPLRSTPLPLDRRIKLLDQMDEWQFLNLSPALVLPLRLEDYEGMLISDIDFKTQTISFSTRFGGSDFNKGKVNVKFPLPNELMDVLQLCKDNRSEGPLFRNRKSWNKKLNTKHSVENRDQLESLFYKEIQKAPSGAVQCPQDKKIIFRKLLKEMGGVSSRYIGKQIKSVIGKNQSERPHDLRASITQEMHESNIRLLELRYLTLHSVNDIINNYSGIQPELEIKKYYDKIAPLLNAIKLRIDYLKKNRT